MGEGPDRRWTGGRAAAAARGLLLPLALLSGTAAWAVCTFTDGVWDGAPLSADNSGGSNDVSGDCQPNNGADLSYEWTAPTTGQYVFSTGADSDTVLVVTDAQDCATEIACDDDGGPGYGSLVVIDAVAGQTYVITVDSYGADAGPFTLSNDLLQPAVCVVDEDLGGALVTRTGTTCGMAGDLSGASCGGGAHGEDAGYLWTAPATGLYTFSTRGSTVDTVLVLSDPADCNGEIACHDDLGGAAGRVSEISTSLDAGEAVHISVDSFARVGATACGDFTFAITAGCPDGDGDGRCDVDDRCVGADSSGDSDFDGTCDSDDFTLTLSGASVAAGTTLQLTADHATPGAQVVFLLSTVGTGIGPCHPAAPICTDLLRPAVVGAARANAQGRASMQLRVPAGAPSGAVATLQAAYLGQLPDAALSEVEIAVVR